MPMAEMLSCKDFNQELNILSFLADNWRTKQRNIPPSSGNWSAQVPSWQRAAS